MTQVFTNGETDNVFANWTANGYRLPTEAEWEKAARGGLSGQRFPWGNSISESQANYYAEPAEFSYDLGPYTGYNTNFNPGTYTSPVGSFAPNGYGLYDMAGNVYEWCWDWFATPYGQPTTNNPTGPAVTQSVLFGPLYVRVMRGGNWDYAAGGARCAFRLNYDLDIGGFVGFRCVQGALVFKKLRQDIIQIAAPTGFEFLFLLWFDKDAAPAALWSVAACPPPVIQSPILARECSRGQRTIFPLRQQSWGTPF